MIPVRRSLFLTALASPATAPWWQIFDAIHACRGPAAPCLQPPPEATGFGPTRTVTLLTPMIRLHLSNNTIVTLVSLLTLPKALEVTRPTHSCKQQSLPVLLLQHLVQVQRTVSPALLPPLAQAPAQNHRAHHHRLTVKFPTFAPHMASSCPCCSWVLSQSSL